MLAGGFVRCSELFPGSFRLDTSLVTDNFMVFCVFFSVTGTACTSTTCHRGGGGT